MAKDSVDDMGNRLGAVVLETIRGAKLPLLLRSGKLLDRSRTLAGKPANFFLASHRPSALSARRADTDLLANTFVASALGRETECCSRGSSIYTVIISE